MVDFASKHALHSNFAQYVQYSGEFRPRLVCEWANFNDSIAYEDNDSGTYAADKMMLPTVQERSEFNFGCGLAEAVISTMYFATYPYSAEHIVLPSWYIIVPYYLRVAP